MIHRAPRLQRPWISPMPWPTLCPIAAAMDLLVIAFSDRATILKSVIDCSSWQRWTRWGRCNGRRPDPIEAPTSWSNGVLGDGGLIPWSTWRWWPDWPRQRERRHQPRGPGNDDAIQSSLMAMMARSRRGDPLHIDDAIRSRRCTGLFPHHDGIQCTGRTRFSPVNPTSRRSP
jgi:hypothetical protein